MPAFVNVSELYCSGWGEKRVADSTSPPQEAFATFEPPPGLKQENVGRGKHEKRQEIIQGIKLKSSYKEYSAILERGEEVLCEVPGTPDPADASISKRKWESLVSKWRAALRQVEKMRNGVCDETADLQFVSVAAKS